MYFGGRAVALRQNTKRKKVMSENLSCYRSPNRKHDQRFFYKYTTAKTTEIILATRKLRWSSPLQFNDPFDVTQELRLNFEEAKLAKVLGEELATLIEKGEVASVDHPNVTALLLFMSHMPPDARQATAQKLRLESGTAAPGLIQAFRALKELWRNMVPTFRILCLSELHDVMPMWLHYADTYRGVVLEFEALDETDSSFLVARPIKYQDSLPAIADPQVWARCMLGQATLSLPDLFTEYQYVKTNQWGYEREWRIVSMARPGETGRFADYSFHPRELAGIYFGPKYPLEQRPNLLALLTHGLEHVRVHEAMTDNVEAKFNFREIRR